MGRLKPPRKAAGQMNLLRHRPFRRWRRHAVQTGRAGLIYITCLYYMFILHITYTYTFTLTVGDSTSGFSSISDDPLPIGFASQRSSRTRIGRRNASSDDVCEAPIVTAVAGLSNKVGG
jgi:hypothetical protein